MEDIQHANFWDSRIPTESTPFSQLKEDDNTLKIEFKDEVINVNGKGLDYLSGKTLVFTDGL